MNQQKTTRAYYCGRGEHSLCGGCRCYCHLFDKGTASLGIALKRLYSGVRSMWPLVARETMTEALAAKDRRHQQALIDLRGRHQRELDEERKQIESLMPRLVQIAAEHRGGRAFGRFHVATEITDELVYRILSSGNPSEIEYMGDRMAHEIRRQIKTIDFVRVKAAADYDDQRRAMPRW